MQKQVADPVFQQLRYVPYKGFSEGTSDPEAIREWSGMPDSIIGVRTGAESGLVALEIPTGENSPLPKKKARRLQRHLPDTRVLEGPDRTYYLFAYPESDADIGQMSRSDGLVLHGEGSVIPVAGPPARRHRKFWWKIDAGERLAPLPSSLKALFGTKDLEGVLSEEAPSPERPPERKPELEHKRRPGLSSRFRSGEELRGGPSLSDLALPWLSKEALSVLTGPAKAAGKSTFVTNLAACQAAGRSFLGQELQARGVVMLSDLPPSQLQALLSELGPCREALSRLHVLHPKDAAQYQWQALLEEAFKQASRVEADLVIVDSIDQFVEAKADLCATESQKVTSLLSTDAPAGCATLAVKSVPVPPATPMSETIDQLQLLGTTADVVARIDNPPSSAHPTLRRVQFKGRLGALPTHLFCEMARGRYRLYRPNSVRGATSFGKAPKTKGIAENLETAGAAMGDGAARKAPRLDAGQRQTHLGLLSNGRADNSTR